MDTPQSASKKKEIAVFRAPYWVAIFVVLAFVVSLVPFIIGFFLGLSVASDAIFGAYALVSGVGVDFVLRSKAKITLLIWRQPKVPFVLFWVVLCFYVMIFHPFE